MQNMVASLEAAQDMLQIPVSPTSPEYTDDTIHHATVQIDSVQSSLKGPRFVVVATGSLLVLPQKDAVLIGRADPRGKVVPDIDLSSYGGGTAGVSRQHARLLRKEDNWMIEDLHSTNGTFVNEERVPPSQPTWLNSGDSVRCGQLVLAFHVDEADSV
jgi:pSer/pThr/pTyr-binding forkhead associated (FHA) protein